MDRLELLLRRFQGFQRIASLPSSVWRRSVVRIFQALPLMILVGSAISVAQGKKSAVPPWNAPEAAKKVANPIKPSPEGLKIGARLFKENCSACHGATGAGNGPLAKALDDKPTNFTNAKAMKTVTDGELFWKMTNGRLPMPSWAQLSDKQRWELVDYLRTLAK
jgi:mono/diheme cytochrome c family protein